MRLGRQHQLVDVGGFPAVIGVPAELGAVGGLALAEQQVIRLALDPLPRLKAEGLRAGTPPLSRRLSPGLAGLDVITGRILDRATVHLLPELVKVVALAQGRHNCHYALRLLGVGAAELPIHIGWCMGDAARNHSSSVTKRPIKIRNLNGKNG